MSKGKSSSSTQTIQRISYRGYGISKNRLKELQNGCRTGAYPVEILAAACAGFEFVRPWILLSVQTGKSFDVMRVRWELGEAEMMPCCRNSFYSFRRQFYSNLDKLLKESLHGREGE